MNKGQEAIFCEANFVTPPWAGVIADSGRCLVIRLFCLMRLLVVCGLLGMCLPVLAAVEVTDYRGVRVRLEKPPQRVVSLLPSLTETVCELGQCQLLVGVDRYSNYPERVTQLPRVGGGLDPNIEAIVALHPDVVLMANTSHVAERLQDLGLKVLVLEPKTLADVRTAILTLGELLAVSNAQQVWRAIDAGLQAAAQSLPPTVKGLRVYYEVGQGPYGASESSFIGEILTSLGVKNILNARLGPFPKLNPEFIVRANPDLIMTVESSATDLLQRPGWHSIRALREDRVCAFSLDQTNALVRPGPRLAEAARLMAQCLGHKAPVASAKKAQP